MRIKKINAVLGLVSTLLALSHVASSALWMMAPAKLPMPSRTTSYLLAACVAVHVLLSLLVVILTHRKETGSRRGRSYAALNREIILQRCSGAAMLLLLPAHILGSFAFFTPKLLHGVIQPLFFAAVLTHTAVSFSRSLITLGIGSASFIRAASLLARILCGLLMAAAAAGFCLIMTGGAAG